MLKDLITVKRMSPNHGGKRTAKISRVTLHIMVAEWTADRCGEHFENPSRQASSNLGIGVDGSVGLYVDLANKSWCSASDYNDQRAVTIELASERKAPYKVNDVTIDKLVDVLVEIVKENPGIGTKLNWRNDPANPGNVTIHRWFSRTECPGEYMMATIPKIVERVNAKLKGMNTDVAPAPSPSKDLVAVAKQIATGNNPYGNGQDRINNLKKAGYTDAEIKTIQTHINNKAWLQNGSTSSQPPVTNREAELKKVARQIAVGNNPYGNGQARIDNLKKAGYSQAEISTIQRHINNRTY